ncbi:hypothetical protein [Chryseobacterium sp.]|uniref:hypothetical protein n=1 Tax=Chryseobacterium sp. TaxID=1871047 RepID=UPI0012A9DDE7|nr:hypothetical protein [Chryseobacterium sp.]QFG53625.1 hypothetical protein F7R58_08700 [Chryseobacterium sp.]
MAPEYFNNSIAVEGEIIVKTMGSNAGSVVVWDPVTKKLSKRTAAEIAGDIGVVPYVGATKNLDLASRSLIANSVKSHQSIFNPNYGVVVASSYVPFDRNSILLKVPYHGMGGFKVKIWSYYNGNIGKEYFEFFISNYRYNDGYHFPEITWIAGDSTRINKVEFLKDGNGLYYINIDVKTSYPKVSITDVMMDDSFPSAIYEWENWNIQFDINVTGLIKEHQKQPADFRRDDFVLSKINNIKVGGRNYILNSQEVVTTTNVVYFAVSSDFPKTKVRNKSLTLSCDYYSKDVVWGTNPNVNHRFFFELAILYTDGVTQYVTIQVTDTADRNERLSKTFKTLNEDIASFSFFVAYVQNIDSGEIIATNFQLEISDIVSDWSPAPENFVSDWNQTNPLALNFIKNKPTINFGNYYTKSEALNLFVGLNSVQTIYDTKNFDSSPVVPNGTLSGHAVNLWQLQNHTHNISDITGLQGVLSELSGLAHTHANKTVLDGITGGHVSDWNAIVADSIRNNGQAFDYNTGNGLGIGDGAYGSESGLFDYSTDYLVVGVLGDYYHYGSADGGYSANGITVGKYTGNVGIGGYNTSIYKALVHGAIAATQGFVHTAHNSRDKVLLSNGNIASATVDVVNDGGTLRMQDFFADISGSSFIGTDTPHKLVHLMISSGHFDLYNLQDGQRIVLINDTGGQCLVKIEDLDAYVIEPKEKVTLYVVNAGNYYFYDASMHTKFTF